MPTLLELAVQVSSQGVGNVERDLGRVESAGQRAEKSVGGAMKNIGGSLQSAGKSMSTFVTLPLAGLGAGMIKLASDAEETASKFGTVFGKQTGEMNKWVTGLMKVMPSTRQEIQGMAAGIQDLLVPIGVAPQKAQSMTKSIVTLTGDLASFNNLPTADVSRDIQSALTGEYDSMKKYGVALNAAAVERKAYTMGIAREGEELTAAQKAQAAYQIILEDTKAAQGDMARTADSTANSFKRLWRDVKEAGTAFGKDLLPVITPVVKFLTTLVGKFGELSPTMRAVIMGVAAFAAAIGPLLVVVGMIVSALGSLMLVTGATGVAGALLAVAAPAFAVVAALAAVAVGVYALFRAWKALKPIIVSAWNGIKAATSAAWNAIKGVIQSVWAFIGPTIKRNLQIIKIAVTAAWNVIKATTTRIWNGIKTFFGGIWKAITSLFKGNSEGVKKGMRQAWQGIKMVIQAAWRGVVALLKIGWATIKALFRSSAPLLKKILLAAWNAIKRGAQRVWNGIKAFFKGLWNAITTIIKLALEGWKRIITGAWNFIKDKTKAAWNAVKDFVAAGIRRAKEIAENTAKNLKSALISVWDAIKSGAKTAWDAMVDIITNPMQRAYEIVAGIWNDLLEGIASVLDKLDMKDAAGKLRGAKMSPTRDPSKRGGNEGSKTQNAQQGGPVYGLATGGVMRNGGMTTSPTVLYGEAGPEAYARLDKRTKQSVEAARAIMQSPNRPPEYGEWVGPGKINPPPHGRDRRMALGGIVRMAMGGVGAAEMAEQVEKKWGIPGNPFGNQHGQYLPADQAARSVDFFVAEPGTMAQGSQKKTGDEIAAFIQPPSTEYAIWYDSANFGGGWSAAYQPVGIGNSNTLNHYDHVHGTAHSGSFEGGKGGGLFGTVSRWVSSGASKLWDKVVQPIIDRTLKTLAGGPLFMQMGGKAFEMATDAIKAHIIQEAGGTGGSNAGTVKDWIRRGLEIGGAFPPTDANIETMYGRAMQESGGDPRAVNDWDVNAAAGTPSKGLFQVIEPTWESERNSYGEAIGPFSSNWDKGDLSAAIASRYMKTRYGSIVGANGQGYSEGGMAVGPQLMALAENAGRELVLPLDNPVARNAIQQSFSAGIERRLETLERSLISKLDDVNFGRRSHEAIERGQENGTRRVMNSDEGTAIVRERNEITRNTISSTRGR